MKRRNSWCYWWFPFSKEIFLWKGEKIEVTASSARATKCTDSLACQRNLCNYNHIQYLSYNIYILNICNIWWDKLKYLHIFKGHKRSNNKYKRSIKYKYNVRKYTFNIYKAYTSSLNSDLYLQIYPYLESRSMNEHNRKFF